MRQKVFAGIVIAIILTGLLTGFVLGQVVPNVTVVDRSGVGDSLYVMSRSGVTGSHLVIGRTSLDAPSNFILTGVSDYIVGISWTKGTGANNTMVRGAVGRTPTSRTDGYLVYYGTGTSCEDTGVDLDQTATEVYYRAWSQGSSGAWEEVGISDSIGGFGMTLLALILLPISFVGLFVWKKHAFLAFLAAGSWVLVGFLAFQASASSSPAEITDIWMALFWMSIAATIACVLLPAVMRDKPSKDDVYVEEFDEVTGDPIPKEEPKLRRKRQRSSRFNRTGE